MRSTLITLLLTARWFGATTPGLAQTPRHPEPSGLSCPGDQTAWVNSRSGIYHLAGERCPAQRSRQVYVSEGGRGLGRPRDSERPVIRLRRDRKRHYRTVSSKSSARPHSQSILHRSLLTCKVATGCNFDPLARAGAVRRQSAKRIQPAKPHGGISGRRAATAKYRPVATNSRTRQRRQRRVAAKHPSSETLTNKVTF